MMVVNDQEDRYYEYKAKVEEALGVELEREQMNRLFFTVIEPLHGKWRGSEKRMDDLLGHLQAVRDILDDSWRNA